MLNLTESQKKIFYTGTYFHGYQMHFPAADLTIDNDTLHSEAVTIKESICGEEEFVLGGCIASSCEFEVSEILQNELNGQEFTATLETVDEDGNKALELPMGTYRVDSAGMVDDKDYKKIVAYDALYGASADVSEWYNGIFPAEEKSVTKLQDGKEVTVKIVEYGTVKLKAMRESLLKYLGIPFESQDLINDDMDVEKTVAPGAGSLTGTTVLKAICMVNGGFGRMNRQGKFEIIYLHDMHSVGLYPHVGLYPRKGLYPTSTNSTAAQDMTKLSGASDTAPEYRSIRCEEYTTDKITCLNIQTDEEDVGVTVGTDLSNPYLITGNFLLYGKSVEELKVIGGNILSKLKGIYYRPVSELKMNALPYLETGDMIVAEKEAEKVYSYIFSRTISGIQALTDTCEAKGNQKRQNEVTQESELTQLKGRTLKIRKSIDGVLIEMANVEKKTTTRFEQTDEAIRLEAKRATDAEEALQSSIDLQADSIVLKVDSDGKLVEVALGVDANEGKNYVKVGADNINLTAEEVLDLISNGTINLSGKNINIESENFTVDSDGNVTARSIDIEGGKIYLSTTQGSESLIKLSHYNVEAAIDGKKADIKYYVERTPGDYEHPEAGGVIVLPYPQVGDLCFNVSGNRLYRFETGDGKARWYERTDDLLDAPATVHWSTSMLTTGEGLYTINYDSVRLEVDNGNGGTTSKMFQNGSSTNVDGDGIHFHKTMYTTRNGTAEQQELEANVTLETAGYDENLQPEPGLKMDCDSVELGKGGQIKDRDDALEFSKAIRPPSVETQNVSTTSLQVNGKKYVTGSVVRDFSADPLPSTGILKLAAPNISGEYPVTVVNGDGEACPDLDFTNVKILPNEGAISVFATKAITGMARITYSYWANE